MFVAKILVTAKVLSWQKYVCHDKHTKDTFCHDEHIFVSQQNFCLDKNDTCGSSCQWYNAHTVFLSQQPSGKVCQVYILPEITEKAGLYFISLTVYSFVAWKYSANYLMPMQDILVIGKFQQLHSPAIVRVMFECLPTALQWELSINFIRSDKFWFPTVLQVRWEAHRSNMLFFLTRRIRYSAWYPCQTNTKCYRMSSYSSESFIVPDVDVTLVFKKFVQTLPLTEKRKKAVIYIYICLD